MKQTHQNQVLTYLKDGKTISQAEAIYHFNCYSLTSVISRLRKSGYEVTTHYESNINNRGMHARYKLKVVEA
ncbi:helix-turn-helix domain-containing protein [Acinetobacter boissieri]|uniref:Helix-turn-helix domain-containing protein n=1 Tax=Acinetobacter boissieri TaxID=1219383 RepID=A0A1G6K416_9GAMM|nr:helix-turn-helix domain-containing protein [Acinetobacter boissieri]SDC25714.1 Helix-turn-helix domain-containing protein [Acinetobacter boissieri]